MPIYVVGYYALDIYIFYKAMYIIDFQSIKNTNS